jgi:hypothetical protein
VRVPLDRLCLVSHFPGRLRVRARTFRSLPDVATRVVKSIEEEPGVISARWSTTTGSLVVEYEPRRIELPELVQLIVEIGGLCGVAADVESDGRAPVDQGAAVRAVLARCNQMLGAWTKGAIDLRTTVPATMAIGSMLMLMLRRRQIPAWYDLAFWSFVTFSNLNARKPVDDARAA